MSEEWRVPSGSDEEATSLGDAIGEDTCGMGKCVWAKGRPVGVHVTSHAKKGAPEKEGQLGAEV